MNVKKIIVIALTLCAYLNVPTAAAQVCESVTVGTSDINFNDGLGNDGNLSIVALKYCNGAVKGQWQDTFYRGGGAVRLDVTCLKIVGNDAWISGPIKSITPAMRGGEALIGVPLIIRVQDNGNAANGGTDKVSFFSFPADDQACLLMPDLPVLDILGGEVKIN